MKSTALRLIYPQWQGRIVAHWVPDLPANDVSRGYCHGLKIDQAVRIINDIASEYDLISLTVAEPMP